MVGSESVSAMMRNRFSLLKLAPFTMSQTKCDAVDALPPLPHVKMCRFLSRASDSISIARETAPRSTVSKALISLDR